MVTAMVTDMVTAMVTAMVTDMVITTVANDVMIRTQKTVKIVDILIILSIMVFLSAVFDVLRVSAQLMADGKQDAIKTMDYGRFRLHIASEKFSNVPMYRRLIMAI